MVFKGRIQYCDAGNGLMGHLWIFHGCEDDAHLLQRSAVHVCVHECVFFQKGHGDIFLANSKAQIPSIPPISLNVL